MNMKQSCKALICAIEGELDGRHCTEEQAAAILDHALPSLTEALARVEAERDAMEAMVSMLEEKEWAEHASKGPVSSRLETCITTLHNELHEANERADEAQVSGMAYAEQRDAAQAQLAEAVGLLRYSQEIARLFDDEHTAEVGRFLARYAQAEQQEAGEMLPRVKHLLPMPAVKPPKPEAQGAQAGDEAEPAVSFAAWMIDHREGQAVTEEDMQAWLAEWYEARAALATQPADGEPIGKVELFGINMTYVEWRDRKMPPLGTKLYAAPPAAAHGDDAVRALKAAFHAVPECTGYDDAVRAGLTAAMRAQGDGEVQ